MPKKKYVCMRYRNLKLLGGIQFKDGFFETDNINIQRRIEDNDLFGGMIKCVDVAEIEEAIRVVSERAKPQAVVLEENLYPEEDDGLDDLIPDGGYSESVEEEGGESPLPHTYLTSTEINRMKKDDLVTVAMDINACLEEDATPIDTDQNIVLLRADVKRKLKK